MSNDDNPVVNRLGLAVSPLASPENWMMRGSDLKSLTQMGPNLQGLFGLTSGSLSGVGYSQAMKAKVVEWQTESLE